jgi:anti-sigma-K factor RskA
VVHLNSELLAGHALGQDDALDAEQRDHLAGCAQCRAELDEYLRVVTLSQETETPTAQVQAMDRIWRSIQAEVSTPPTVEREQPVQTLSADSVPLPVETEDVANIGSGEKSITGRRRKWWAVVAAAAALGLVVGAGATVIVSRNRVEVAASVPLSALPGHTGHGTAELLRGRDDPELRVSVEAPLPQDRYREVWLINSDGKRMYSLGVLPPSGSGTYPLPALLGDGLEGFTIVDVSIEPYDGNPEHSRDSQVRGSLPE